MVNTGMHLISIGISNSSHTNLIFIVMRMARKRKMQEFRDSFNSEYSPTTFS